MHLAQINVARIRFPLDDPRMEGFVSQLAAVNELAEASPGFVWRLVGAGDNATDVQAFDDTAILINMSVWESIEALREYVYRSRHGAFLRSRSDWFERFDGPYTALWWVPPGHIPTVAEGVERLEHLSVHGPTDFAFSFARPVSTPAGAES